MAFYFSKVTDAKRQYLQNSELKQFSTWTSIPSQYVSQS